MSIIAVSKDASNEFPIPSVWRTGLKCLADSVVSPKKIEADKHVSILPIDAEIQEINFANIADYPDSLGQLAEKSWDSSVCIWAAGHWNVLIDLSDQDGETTDLVLHAKVRENGKKFLVEPGLIYVP